MFPQNHFGNEKQTSFPGRIKIKRKVTVPTGLIAISYCQILIILVIFVVQIWIIKQPPSEPSSNCCINQSGEVRFTTESWVSSKLPIELVNCFLFVLYDVIEQDWMQAVTLSTTVSHWFELEVIMFILPRTIPRLFHENLACCGQNWAYFTLLPQLTLFYTQFRAGVMLDLVQS